MLRQLKEKFLNINNQTLKWVRLQDQLLQTMEELLSTIQHSGRIYLIVEESAKDNNSSSIMSNDEKKEILIGLRLVRKQIKLKYYHKKQNITIVRHDFLRFDSITNDFIKLLTNYRDNLEHTDKIIKQLHSNTSSDVINVSAKQLINSNMTIKNNIITNIKDLETILSTIDRLQTKSNNNNNNTNSDVVAESKKNMKTPNDELIIRIESNGDEEVIQNVKIVSFDPTCIISSRLTISSSYNSESLSGIGSVVVTNAAAAASTSSTTANDTIMVNATLIAIDSSSSWTSPINNLTSQSTPSSSSSSSSLILYIPPSEIVSSILLQSGFAINNNNDNNDININKHSSVVSHDSNHSKAPLPAVELPCGISLASLEPRVELTSNALGDVIDWTILLKSSAPEKFLKRPPVRFLFDLIRYIGDTNDGFLDSSLAFADWTTVGVDKASKILFMDNVSSFSLCIVCSWIDVCVRWMGKFKLMK
jgi:hypothetical protein